MTLRLRNLIHEFANELLAGGNPFDQDFLIKQSVNAAELVALRGLIGSIFMFYLQQTGGTPRETT